MLKTENLSGLKHQLDEKLCHAEFCKLDLRLLSTSGIQGQHCCCARETHWLNEIYLTQESVHPLLLSAKETKWHLPVHFCICN